jgi:hypothetical protein
MRGYRPVVLTILASLALHVPAQAEPRPLGFEGADWIWMQPDPAQPSGQYPAGSCYFRGVLLLPEKCAIKMADA